MGQAIKYQEKLHQDEDRAISVVRDILDRHVLLGEFSQSLDEIPVDDASEMLAALYGNRDADE